MEYNYKHFFNRAAFGVYPEDESRKKKDDYTTILTISGQEKPINIGSADYIKSPAKDKAGTAEKKEMKEELRRTQIRLNTTWINQMTDPTAVLREKMTFFWHDHFACNTKNPVLGLRLNNTIRKHALGKFSDLLTAVSKEAAMLQFLNNQQNKKDSPNENFAREVMELFTLGRGQYTESDIKNAARAFTGWAFDPRIGEFIFRPRVHDYSSKTFRGKTGNFSGEDIIAMILEDRNTARFITRKVWQFLVHGEKMDEAILNALTEKFYTSGYDISGLLSGIFNSKWFYSEDYRGNRIKSPIELMVGMMVHTNGKFNNPGNLIFLQKAMGQVLFQPPNVGGWPTGKEWIDSSSLAFRMSLPTVLMRNSETDFQAKDDGDANNETNAFDKARKISFGVDWQKLSNIFTKTTSGSTVSAIEDYLLAKPTSSDNRKMVEKIADLNPDGPEFVKQAFISFMSLPDYQLC